MTETQAQTRANKLIKKLDITGSGWKADVWYNLGWCYAAHDKSRRINVYPVDDKQNTKYDCLISYTPGSGGLSLWTDRNNRQYHRDPVQAVNQALKYARNCIDKLNASLKEAEKAWDLSRIADRSDIHPKRSR